MTAHDQAAAFVLDALDRDEVRAFELHLEVCPDCEDELEPFRLAAVALAFAGELPAPRPELRLRVLDVSVVVIPFRRRVRGPVLAALTVAAACAAIVLGLQSREGGVSSAEGRALTVLKADGTRAFPAHGADATLIVGHDGDAVLVVRRLPQAPAGTEYELWVIHGDHATPAGFVGDRLAVLDRRVPPGATVAVSLEPRGGSTRPSGRLLIRADTA